LALDIVAVVFNIRAIMALKKFEKGMKDYKFKYGKYPRLF